MYFRYHIYFFYISPQTHYVKREILHKRLFFINKIKNLQNIPEGAIYVTADAVGFCPSTPHEAFLNTLREALDNRENKHIPTYNLLKMAEFVMVKLKNSR